MPTQLKQTIGIHTFAALKGTENYDLIRDGLKPVIEKINELIHTREIVLSNRQKVLINIF